MNTPETTTPTPEVPAHGSRPSAVPRRRRYSSALLVACMATTAVVGGGVGAAATAWFTDEPAQHQPASQSETAVSGASASSSATMNTVSAAATAASPSTVTLSVAGSNGAGSGSGIVLDDEGHVLTNNHVVTLGGQTSDPTITVQLADGSVTSAEIVGTDPDSDLAVVKLADATGIAPATLGDSSALSVGDQVIAIGSPLGLDGTVTEGIVSALDRTISVASSDASDAQGNDQENQSTPQPEQRFRFNLPQESPQGAQEYIHLNVIQTDASINQGNSGGALINDDGEVVGINVALASPGGTSESAGNVGVGFAIPIDYASRIADDLIAEGSASHGLLGVLVADAGAVDSDDSANSRFTSGASIERVEEDSPAAEAGVEEGDVVVAVGDRSITDAASLTAAVREYAQGEQVSLTYRRGDQEAETTVTVG